jgi:dolichol-phosphate mannosyltransferase
MPAGAPDPRSDLSPSSALLSIVLPVYNEEAVLPESYRRLSAMRATFASYELEYELVFVNDGSRDGSAEMLDALAATDPRTRVVHLARNFGHQAAITAGIELARGDVVAVMDCDLQDPPEVLPDFLERWREGYDVIFAIRQARKEWLGKRAAYWVFYRLLSAISELDIPLDSGDFCVMDRSAVNLLNGLPERQRFVRGLRSWVGLRQTGVAYQREARFAGTPKYTFKSLLKLALDGLVSFSSVPLRLITRFGLLSGLAAMLLTIWVLIGALTTTATPPGWASLGIIVLVMGAIQLVSLGVLGEYLSRVFLEVKARPTYLVARIVESSEAPFHPRPPHTGSPGAKEDVRVQTHRT